MFSTLRTRFGIPGVISVIALVFAMLGGAYAANNQLRRQGHRLGQGQEGPTGSEGALDQRVPQDRPVPTATTAQRVERRTG